MELRSCGNAHFIQTIREGLVIKVCSIDPRGRAGIRFKTLKDVYMSEDSRRLHQSPPGLMLDHEKVECENPCFPVADRTLWEIKSETYEYVPGAVDDVDSELDDETTLKQLKKRFSTKKRKCVHSDENSKQDDANVKALEDESDLNMPLINFKSKRSKISKAKTQHMGISAVSSSALDCTVKSEDSLLSEGSQQVGGEPAPVIHVKLEAPYAEQLGCQNETSTVDDSLVVNNDVLNTDGIASEFQNMALCEHREPLLCANEHQNCAINESLDDHLEDVEPIHCVVVPWGGITIKSEPSESACEEFLDLTPLAAEKGEEIRDAHSCTRSWSEDPNSDMCSHSSSTCMKEKSEHSISGIEVPDMASDGNVGCNGLHQEFTSVQFEDKIEPGFPQEQDDSPSSPDKNSGSYLDPSMPLNTDENLPSVEDAKANEELPSAYSVDAITKNDLNSEDHISNDLLKGEETQAPASPINYADSQFTLKDDSNETISTPEPCQPPERLHSTRKAISPSSQERLRLAMNSVELIDDADQYFVLECKEKVFGKQTRKKASPVKSDIQYDKLTANHRQPGQVNQQKVIISPKHINKSQAAKVNIEGPRFSRTLPNLSTGCTSIQGCSEGAIAFSQRQMQDMESLAVKLMNELKSMKDIVEQKLLFEAYRSVSLKNDADEVKSAINNATKVEESARKWLSMMARDCNRFCKIMKMTPSSTATSRDTGPGQRRKIMFADEAGGKLCHVKFFENGVTSPVPDGLKQ